MVYSYLKRCPYCLTKIKNAVRAGITAPVNEPVNGAIREIADSGRQEKVVFTSSVSSKEVLRSNLLAVRDSLSVDEKIKRSKLAIEHLLQIKRFNDCKVVLCYASFRNEVGTSELIRTLLAEGKIVSVPLISVGLSGESGFSAIRIRDYDADLKPGTFGILEPSLLSSSGSIDFEIIEPQRLDAVILPGVCFDRSGNRIGFGKGYFDRYLANVKTDCFKVALAYSFQVLESIPVDSHDMHMDMVVTDEIIIG